jgi:heme exporter protein D
MPDLGKYAETVLSAYAVSLVLILGLIVVSILRSNRIRKELQKVESKGKKHG